MQKPTLEKLAKPEVVVNKNLFLITTIITVIVMGMVITEFFTRGELPITRGIGFFYMGILFLYSLHKETLRWLQKKGEDRQGEKFVYAWIALAIVLYLVNFVSGCHFETSADGTPLHILDEISVTTLEVFAIFVLTRISKIIKVSLLKNKQAC